MVRLVKEEEVQLFPLSNDVYIILEGGINRSQRVNGKIQREFTDETFVILGFVKRSVDQGTCQRYLESIIV